MDIVKLMEEARDFVDLNLLTLCLEMREWDTTAVLRDGKVRELASMLDFTNNGLNVAETLINSAAFDFVIKKGE